MEYFPMNVAFKVVDICIFYTPVDFMRTHIHTPTHTNEE